MERIITVLKLLFKAPRLSAEIDKKLFSFGNLLLFVSIIVGFLSIPFCENFFLSTSNFGILYLLMAIFLLYVSFTLVGLSCNNSWSQLGGLRLATQFFSFALPILFCCLTVLTSNGTLNPIEIVHQQSSFFWNIFHHPFLFISFFIFYTLVLFNMPNSEEIFTGHTAALSGISYGLHSFCTLLERFMLCAVLTTLFLGGWHLPFLNLSAMSLGIRIPFEIFIVVSKTLFLWITMEWISVSFPKYRTDQLLKFSWQIALPLSLVCFMGAATWMVLFKGWSNS